MSGQPEPDRKAGGFDAGAIRRQFAILNREIAWLDNAATTQRPEAVLQAMDRFYRQHNANVRRSVHRLGAEATADYEGARATVAEFVGAAAPEEIVFTSGTTAAINLATFGFARWEIGPGDEVWVSAMEHHSNWVPWQQAVKGVGATLKVIPLAPDGRLDLEAFRQGLAAHRAKWVAVAWVSNVLGVENDVRAICGLARAAGARVLVDGAQGVAHRKADVAAWGCDFFAFSGHKTYGPMGIGALWGRRELLEQTEPILFGGEMIARVDDLKSTWAEPPYRFEAGTPNVAGAVGLAAAIDWVRELPAGAHAYVAALAREAAARLAELPGVRVWGPADGRTSLVAFSVAGVHAHDVAQVLDGRGVAVRAGHMCAQPLLRRLGVESAVRASFAPYNVPDEIRRLVEGVRAAQELFHVNDVYQAALLAHAKHPYGAGAVPRGTEDAEALNSGCGDEIRVKLAWTPGGGLERLVYELHGCAVSVAAASMAARRLEGKTPAEIAATAAAFAARLGQSGFEEEWGDFRAFNGIERFPARLHCARLVWQALEKALARKKAGP